MEWTIDTGLLGDAGCPAADVQKVLEAARDHYAKTQPESAHAAVWYKADPAARNEPAKAALLSKDAEAAAEDVRAKLPAIQKQMDGGIKAAVDLATAMGGQVTASVRGHIVKNRPDGVFRRISVHVDRARPVEQEE